MFSFLKNGLFGLTLGTGLLLVGCQSGGAEAPPSHEMAANAVQCDKCQMTWVRSPIDAGKGHIVGYTSHKQMECPDCKDAVSNSFATGNLKHECKACAGNMAICDAH